MLAIKRLRDYWVNQEDCRHAVNLQTYLLAERGEAPVGSEPREGGDECGKEEYDGGQRGRE